MKPTKLDHIAYWVANRDEVADFAARCRYRDCSHTVEDGCAVRDALDAGDLDPERWESYRKLEREIRRHEILTDRTAAIAEKQRWKAIHRSMRVHYKTVGRK